MQHPNNIKFTKSTIFGLILTGLMISANIYYFFNPTLKVTEFF